MLNGFKRKFFLGMAVDSLFQQALSSVNRQILDYYIQNTGNYLQEVSFQEERYLGCFLTSPTETSHLELMELHIFSLLKRLLPHYPYQNSALWLIPLVELSQQED